MSNFLFGVSATIKPPVVNYGVPFNEMPLVVDGATGPQKLACCLLHFSRKKNSSKKMRQFLSETSGLFTPDGAQLSKESTR